MHFGLMLFKGKPEYGIISIILDMEKLYWFLCKNHLPVHTGVASQKAKKQAAFR